MKIIPCGLVLFFSATSLANGDTASAIHSLEVRANAPTVEVSPRSAARNYLRLPTLSFTFQLTAHCSVGFNPDAVSLSIADSRRSLTADQLSGQEVSTEMTLRVPARQLAPLAIENFCVRPVENESAELVDRSNYRGSASMTVSAALSAQASLLCVDEDLEEIVYASNPLDITLVCKSAADTAK